MFFLGCLNLHPPRPKAKSLNLKQLFYIGLFCAIDEEEIKLKINNSRPNLEMLHILLVSIYKEELLNSKLKIIIVFTRLNKKYSLSTWSVA